MNMYHCISTPLVSNSGEPLAVTVNTLDHAEGVKHLCAGYDISSDDWPDGYGISNEVVTLSTHQGTHIDAPLHYHPEGIDVSELDVNDFIGKAVIVKDLGSLAHAVNVDRDKYINTLDEYMTCAKAVFFITGAYKYFDKPEYFTDFKGVPVELVRLALDRGYKVIGTDAFSLDPPFRVMSENYIETKDKSVLWPTHVLGRQRPYYQIERLGNLEIFEDAKLVDFISLPIKLRCGASWTRAVARKIK